MIYTKKALALKEGDTMKLKGEASLTCTYEGASGKAFTYWYRNQYDVEENVGLLYREEDGRWLCGYHVAHMNQYRSSFLTPDYYKQGWSYAIARTIDGLAGCRDFPTAGRAIQAYIRFVDKA